MAHNQVLVMQVTRPTIAALVALTTAAFVVRLLALLQTVELPADGPAHAIFAWYWSQHPHIPTYGQWPPGFLYLAGPFFFIFPDPLFSTRLLNLILGTLTIPIFYALLRRIYDQRAAFLSAALLGFMPLHISISTSSLTEVAYVAEALVGVVCLLAGMAPVVPLVFLCLAIMTRYEAWLLIPLFSVYEFWKHKSVKSSIIITGVLGAFPAAWIIGCYMHLGDGLYGVHAATEEAFRNTTTISALQALRVLAILAVSNVGWVLSIAVVIGVAQQLVELWRRQIDAERTLFISLFMVSVVTVLYAAVERGGRLHDRYVLFALVLALPFAVLPFSRLAATWVRCLGLGVFLVASIYFTQHTRNGVPVVTAFDFTSPYVAPRGRSSIETLSAWLRASAYRDRWIVMTKMNWQSIFLPLYFRETKLQWEPVYDTRYLPPDGSRCLIVSDYIAKSEVLRFATSLKEQSSFIFITSEGDINERKVWEGAWGEELVGEFLHQEGDIKVYLVTTPLQIEGAEAAPIVADRRDEVAGAGAFNRACSGLAGPCAL